MAVSAYAEMSLLAIGVSVGYMGGTPEYKNKVEQLQAEAVIWDRLVLAFPFIAAGILAFGRRREPMPEQVGPTILSYPASREGWYSPLIRYAAFWVVSVLGTIGFMICYVIIGTLILALEHAFKRA